MLFDFYANQLEGIKGILAVYEPSIIRVIKYIWE